MSAAMLPLGLRLGRDDQVEARDEDREVLDLQRAERHPSRTRTPLAATWSLSTHPGDASGSGSVEQAP